MKIRKNYLCRISKIQNSAMQNLMKIPTLPACDSPIFGSGPLLARAQLLSVFPDSKTFVDLRVKTTENEVWENFKKFLLVHGNNIDRRKMKHFIKRNFDTKNQNSEFIEWHPSDWTSQPKYLDKLKFFPELSDMAESVNQKWMTLSRMVSPSIMQNPELSTLMPLKHGFIIPGGRFKEVYYWDTYWIMRGLICSEMQKTVLGMLENFFEQVKTLGHIPNGNRTYYERRSQPPYLISMTKLYVDKQLPDTTYLRKRIGLLEKELKYWEENRQVTLTWNGQQYRAFRYGADCNGPRPESFKEDHEMAHSAFKTVREREEFYLHIKAATESGWDFSSRWFIDEVGGKSGTVINTKAHLILPVDLNALMFKNYEKMRKWFTLIGNMEKAQEYEKKAKKMMDSMNNLFWDPSEKMWFDIDLINSKRRRYFHASNLTPLWCVAYDFEKREYFADCATAYMDKYKIAEFPGGVPCTLDHTEEQWDFNVWPPLQHMIVSGLIKTRHPPAVTRAMAIAKNYVKSVRQKCEFTDCKVFEKYRPDKPGSPGTGGEYSVEEGFGWSNGVLIDFLVKFGHRTLLLN